jgi:hypothetical protein
MKKRLRKLFVIRNERRYWRPLSISVCVCAHTQARACSTPNPVARHRCHPCSYVNEGTCVLQALARAGGLPECFVMFKNEDAREEWPELELL